MFGLAILGSAIVSRADQVRNLYPGTDPGPAKVIHEGSIFTLSNKALSVSWDLGAELHAGVRFLDKSSGVVYRLGETRNTWVFPWRIPNRGRQLRSVMGQGFQTEKEAHKWKPILVFAT